VPAGSTRFYDRLRVKGFPVTSRDRAIVGLLLLLVPAARWWTPLAAAPGSRTAAARLQTESRTVHVTVVTDKGAAVPDLAPEDFEISEEGKRRRVIRAAPATAPLSLAILLDDKGGDINEIRVGMATLLSRIEGHGEASLITVAPSIARVFDYASSGAALRAGLQRLVYRPGPSGGLLLQAIADTADELHRREVARPAIVVVTFEGDEPQSHTTARSVLAALERSRAVLHVVAVGKPRLARMNRALVESEGVQGDDWVVDQNNRNAVLGDGPKQSGGRRHELMLASGLTAAMAEVTDDLLHQYSVVYGSISDGKASHKLAVTVKRKGLTVRAPVRVGG
jgi:VWFA-related protein